MQILLGPTTERTMFCHVFTNLVICASCLCCLSAQPVTPEINQETSPNILFLFADDQRVDTIGAYGNEQIKTPHIDRLVNDGFSFRNAYCFGSPHGAVCMPSRAMLHTGHSLYRLNNLQMTGHRTLGQILSEQGYQTFGTGKWHNGKESFARSFDKGRNIMFGGMSDHSKVPITQMKTDKSFSKATTGKNFSSKLFADAAIDFLESRDKESPFFCYVSFTAPHDPRMSPGSFNRLYKPEDMRVPENFLPQHPFDNGQLTTRDEKLGPWPRTKELIQHQTADYFGLISHLDQQVGRILDALKTSGADKNTIIIYAADHGLGMGSHGLLGKQSLYEHSMKAPLVISGPGIPQGSSESLVYLHDLFPTILNCCRVESIEKFDGRSLIPLTGKDPPDGRQFLFTTYGKLMRAVRNERFKLIVYPQINKTQLFDLQNDPHEMSPLDDESAKTFMRGALEALQSAHGDTLPLTVEDPKPAEIDLTGRGRKPDQWQPDWIVRKYFDGVKADGSRLENEKPANKK